MTLRTLLIIKLVDSGFAISIGVSVNYGNFGLAAALFVVVLSYLADRITYGR